MCDYLHSAGDVVIPPRRYRPSTHRREQSFPTVGATFVLGVIVLAAVAYREGWEAVLFLLIFLAIWHLGSYRAVG